MGGCCQCKRKGVKYSLVLSGKGRGVKYGWMLSGVRGKV